MSLSKSLGACRFDRSKYLILPRSRWLDAARRGLRARGVTGGDRLFLYVSKQTHRVVLGYWIKGRPGGVLRTFIVLRTLGAHPDAYPGVAPSVAFLAKRLRPARRQAVEGLRALREEEYAERRVNADEAEARKEYLKWASKTSPGLAAAVANGHLPAVFNSSGESREAAVEAVQRMTSQVAPKIQVVKE